MPVKENIRRFIKENNITISEFAKAAGLSYKNFYRQLNGEVRFKQDDLVKISKVLMLSAEELCKTLELSYSYKEGDPLEIKRVHDRKQHIRYRTCK